MIRKNCFFVSLVICAFLSNTHALNSTAFQKRNDQKDLKHEVTVTLKLVQVYVTDKRGNPITDLEKSEFIIYDNNKRQTITDFEKHALSHPSVETKIQKEKRDAPILKKINRKFFFFFDFAFNNVGGIYMAKKAALHFIDSQVDSTDEVAVLSYSANKGLVLHEYLTTDHSRIREIIFKVGSSVALGRAGRFLKELESETISGPQQRLQMIKQAREDFIRIGGKTQLKYEARDFSLAVKNLAKALQYIPGQKYIILFSTGIPDFIAYPKSSSIAPKVNTMNIAASDSLDFRIRYEKMSRELKAANSPVYSVNVEGIYSDFMEREGETPLSRSITGLYKPDAGIAARDRRGVSSLRNLAKYSGGKYFDNVNDYQKIVEEIHTLTSNYYVLGYYIDEKWDGKYHKIKVKVKRKGCEVYGQSGYFNPKPFHKYTELEKKLHLVDLALTERPHFRDPIHFPSLTLSYSIWKESNVLMLTDINIDEMKEVLGGKSEIVFLIFDEKKNIAGYQRTELDSSKFSQNNIFCYAIASLNPGKYDCRVVARNLENGEGALASSKVFIPKTPDSGLRLYPPLLLIPAPGGFYVNATTNKMEGGYSALTHIYPFDSNQYSPLITELKKDTSELLVITRCSLFDIPSEAKIKISARLMHQPTNNWIPLTITTEPQYQDNNFIFSFKIQPNELLQGKHYIYIFAEEMNTGSKSSINTAFVID